MLHSENVTNQIKVMLFDEDRNEISAFENTPGLYLNSRSRLCMYHRGKLQLLPLYKHLRRTRNVLGEIVVNKFENLCDVISDEVESEEEYKLIYNLAKMWIDAAIAESIIYPSQATDLMQQMITIDINKKNIT